MNVVGKATDKVRPAISRAAVFALAVLVGAASAFDGTSLLLLGLLGSAGGGIFCWLFRDDPDPWSSAWQRARLRRSPALHHSYRTAGPVAWRAGVGLLAGLLLRVWLGS